MKNGKLVLKVDMLDFKEILMIEIFCSICIYLVLKLIS